LKTDPLYKNATLVENLPYKRFIWESTQDWVWPSGIAEGPESPEEIERLIHWWVNWNLWIEFAALKRSDLVYVRYKLEDMSPNLLQNIGSVIQPNVVQPRIQHCRDIVQSVSTTLNRHRIPNERITYHMLPPAARLLMHRYGYTPS
jgi:hypothetical protein